LVNERLARPADPRDFIQANLRIVPVPSLPEIRLYAAHPGSGLSRLIDDDAPPPYWAHHWAGGAVLARYVLDHPATVAGRRVLDLGAGSGVVGIAAAKAGAVEVVAADIDPYAVAALGLNAELNGVALAALGEDLTGGPPPAVDLVLVGDLFYARALAVRVTAFLDRCLAAGIEVLIGDPGRSHLPRERLRLLAERRAPDVDQVRDGALALSGVFALLPKGG
jgi:predicted nicotinamide N-methyase